MEPKYIQIYFFNNPNYKYFVNCYYEYEFNSNGQPIFLHVDKVNANGEEERHTYPLTNVERVVERKMRHDEQ